MMVQADNIRPWVALSPGMVEIIARSVPIHRVEHLGLYKHPHMGDLRGHKDDDPVPIDDTSCQVMLAPGIHETTHEVQKYALARLPCGQWLYWEGRE